MDELTKIDFRNNISAFAYLLLATLGAMFTIAAATNTPYNPVILIIVEILVGASGIFLLVLKKRDLTALSMLMFSMLFGYYTVTGGVLKSLATPVLLCFFIIFALFLLTTNEKKKTCYFCVFFPYGIGAIIIAIFGAPTIVTLIMHAFFAGIALLYAIIYASEKIHLPLAKKLRADEDIQFTKIGPVLGYYIFSAMVIAVAISQLTGLLSEELLASVFLIGGVSLIISGFVNAIFAQNRFTPLMFILMGIACTIISFGENLVLFIGGGIFLVLFLCTLLQKKSMVLPALMLLFAGVLFILCGVGVSLAIFAAILGILSGLIALYLTFALLNEKKSLPIF